MTSSIIGTAIIDAYNRKYNNQALGEYEWNVVQGMLNTDREKLKGEIKHLGLSKSSVREYELFIDEDLDTTDWEDMRLDDITGDVFEQYELDAYLGDFSDDFDVDAIISEATIVDPRTGNRYWREGIDLADICMRHEPDWYAVDAYDAREKTVHRLFVGDAETACKMAAERASGKNLVDGDGEPVEPGWDDNALFYRATLISSQAARDYLEAVETSIPHVGELLTIQQAADELGITRQSCYELVRRGTLASEECDGIRVGRYSVVVRKGI